MQVFCSGKRETDQQMGKDQSMWKEKRYFPLLLFLLNWIICNYVEQMMIFYKNGKIYSLPVNCDIGIDTVESTNALKLRSNSLLKQKAKAWEGMFIFCLRGVWPILVHGCVKSN